MSNYTWYVTYYEAENIPEDYYRRRTMVLVKMDLNTGNSITVFCTNINNVESAAKTLSNMVIEEYPAQVIIGTPILREQFTEFVVGTVDEFIYKQNGIIEKKQ